MLDNKISFPLLDANAAHKYTTFMRKKSHEKIFTYVSYVTMIFFYTTYAPETKWFVNILCENKASDGDLVHMDTGDPILLKIKNHVFEVQKF